jgi:hypothetical protein
MSNSRDSNALVDRRRGFLAGALLGASLRLLVEVSFVFYLINWGTGFDDMNGYAYWLGLMSAVIGVLVGGAACATCRPKLGAFLGAIMSGCSCFGLVLLPFSPVARAVAKPSDPVGAAVVELLCGLVGMILAGAIAGGVGAWAGREAGRWFRLIFA